MSQSKVVSINGVSYDSISGLAVEGGAPITQVELRRVQSVHAKGVHKAQQRSQALNRKFVKKVASPASQINHPQPQTRSIDVKRVQSRSPHISKFARDPQALVQKRSVSDIGPASHPAVAKHAAQSNRASQPQAKAPTSQDIKHAAIGHALANAKPSNDMPSQSKRRAWNVASASLGVLLVAGYFTYINMPNLSVRIAAAQAGIDASYPEYRPIGYRLNGPVAYQNGMVSMKFASNSSPVAFVLNQSKSTWDSSALLEKYVGPKSDGRYATYNDAGLTVYTYGTNAAWVNGGVLYTVEGDATLSNEQVRRIATSL